MGDSRPDWTDIGGCTEKGGEPYGSIWFAVQRLQCDMELHGAAKGITFCCHWREGKKLGGCQSSPRGLIALADAAKALNGPHTKRADEAIKGKPADSNQRAAMGGGNRAHPRRLFLPCNLS